MKNEKILVTGGAGFIGFHLSKKLLEEGYTVVGYDNLNDYYDVSLKYSRLDILKTYENYTFIKGDLADKDAVNKLFEENSASPTRRIIARSAIT
jgi:UDP-glucuronate 4-epimerase